MDGMVPALALKVAEADDAATVTEAATVSAALLLDSEMLAPPAGAAFDNVTVQLLLAFDPKLLGEQATEDNSTGATRLIPAVLVLPL